MNAPSQPRQGLESGTPEAPLRLFTNIALFFVPLSLLMARAFSRLMDEWMMRVSPETAGGGHYLSLLLLPLCGLALVAAAVVRGERPRWVLVLLSVVCLGWLFLCLHVASHQERFRFPRDDRPGPGWIVPGWMGC